MLMLFATYRTMPDAVPKFVRPPRAVVQVTPPPPHGAVPDVIVSITFFHNLREVMVYLLQANKRRFVQKKRTNLIWFLVSGNFSNYSTIISSELAAELRKSA